MPKKTDYSTATLFLLEINCEMEFLIACDLVASLLFGLNGPQGDLGLNKRQGLI